MTKKANAKKSANKRSQVIRSRRSIQVRAKAAPRKVGATPPTAARRNPQVTTRARTGSATRRPASAPATRTSVATSRLALKSGPVVAPRLARVAYPSRTPVAAARPLGKRELKEFRKLLEAERERLREELDALEERIPEVDQKLGMDVGGSYDEDFADVAGDTFEREKGFAIESSVQALLNQVEEALARMETGHYGICEYCGRWIHSDRLRALPYAKLCIECKAKEERANGAVRVSAKTG